MAAPVSTFSKVKQLCCSEDELQVVFGEKLFNYHLTSAPCVLRKNLDFTHNYEALINFNIDAEKNPKYANGDVKR